MLLNRFFFRSLRQHYTVIQSSLAAPVAAQSTRSDEESDLDLDLDLGSFAGGGSLARYDARRKTREELEKEKQEYEALWGDPPKDRPNEVVIAAGSNMGDRLRYLTEGIKALAKASVKVMWHSCLYETKPVGFINQNDFLNAAIIGSTELPPQALLFELKKIEKAAGRDLDSEERNGPRPLDLDIIFYGPNHHKFSNLVIPHVRWQERDFVKAPLVDLYGIDDYTPQPSIPVPTYDDYGNEVDKYLPPEEAKELDHTLEYLPKAVPKIPTFQLTAKYGKRRMAAEAARKAARHAARESRRRERHPVDRGLDMALGKINVQKDENNMHKCRMPLTKAHALWLRENGEERIGLDVKRVVPINSSLYEFGKQTLVMGILNVTPDSFSDGGQHNSVDAAVKHAREMMDQGADIIDVGGQSTRPGADQISAEEECSRVVPVIKAVSELAAEQGKLVSIDTFWSDVAREAVESGAHIVNDVSGGKFDDKMFKVVASLGVPYILMHMRGTPQAMTNEENTAYEDLCLEVGAELQEQARKAMHDGVLAWNIMLDPGIGFAKTHAGNMELIQGLSRLRNDVLQGACKHMPMLVGVSRKGFLGTLTGRKQAEERDVASAAMTMPLVQSGVDIIRVHNVGYAADAVKIADAMYRQ